MKTRRIGIIGYDGLQALDVAGPADVFATANSRLERKTAPYEIVLLGLHEGPIATESGLSLYTDTTLSRHGLLDTIIIPGGRALREKPKVRAALPGGCASTRTEHTALLQSAPEFTRLRNQAC